MQQLNRRLLIALATLLVVCGVGLARPALAEHGSDSSGSGSSGSNSGSGSDSSKPEDSSTSNNTTVAAETENETEVENHARDLKEQFKKQGLEKIQANVKEKSKERTGEQRQKSCEARKTALTNRMNNAVKHAQKHKEVFDKLYTKVKAFHDDKNLNTPNYDELLAKVDAASADAASQISALQSLNIEVDCTQTGSLATNISAFREAVRSTRDSLKDYRKSLVSLITALHDGAKDSTDDSSTNTESTN